MNVEVNSSKLDEARGTADLAGRHYLFEFDSERGGPVKIRLASASGWDGGGREFGDERAIENIGQALVAGIGGINPEHHAIELVRVTEQPDGVVLYERDAEPDNN